MLSYSDVSDTNKAIARRTLTLAQHTLQFVFLRAQSRPGACGLKRDPRRRRECTLGRGVLDGGDGLSRRVTRVSAGWEGAAAALALCKKLALVSRVPLQFTRVSSTEKASLATKESEKESC